jgi:hypothetical protein
MSTQYEALYTVLCKNLRLISTLKVLRYVFTQAFLPKTHNKHQLIHYIKEVFIRFISDIIY